MTTAPRPRSKKGSYPAPTAPVKIPHAPTLSSRPPSPPPPITLQTPPTRRPRSKSGPRRAAPNPKAGPPSESTLERRHKRELAEAHDRERRALSEIAAQREGIEAMLDRRLRKAREKQPVTVAFGSGVPARPGAAASVHEAVWSKHFRARRRGTRSRSPGRSRSRSRGRGREEGEGEREMEDDGHEERQVAGEEEEAERWVAEAFASESEDLVPANDAPPTARLGPAPTQSSSASCQTSIPSVCDSGFTDTSSIASSGGSHFDSNENPKADAMHAEIRSFLANLARSDDLALAFACDETLGMTPDERGRCLFFQAREEELIMSITHVVALLGRFQRLLWKAESKAMVIRMRAEALELKSSRTALIPHASIVTLQFSVQLEDPAPARPLTSTQCRLLSGAVVHSKEIPFCFPLTAPSCYSRTFADRPRPSLPYPQPELVVEGKDQQPGNRVDNLMQPANCTWSHATNTATALVAVVASGVDYVEADVSFADGVAFMAHDAHEAPTVDDRAARALPSWFGHWPRSGHSPAGVKLDFKSPQAVPIAIDWLVAGGAPPGASIWLNADVLRGPRGRVPVHDPARFVDECRRLVSGGAVVSLGWTTGDVEDDGASIGYDSGMIDAMLALCADDTALVKAHVTFAMRAIDLLATRAEDIGRLLRPSPRWTLTVWRGREGADRAAINARFDPARTYIDI
ncbi:hypothetical protein BDK51DRAFT_41240 [Blyttiomyces helicus]|uniref:Menorin-like domain-containing protein n=1 Tax=Blyttiomyces helicus TaxID=388810 RepID=A0A4P9WJP5_9FUNG|nr:hypothetical protein BDK51DRAFT_41240 [Blyttiomyces helicus]|eukprot:RKO92994.1 hypothetical protein BDK51DRAFT_41240 [Blyttiomyces helicus]